MLELLELNSLLFDSILKLLIFQLKLVVKLDLSEPLLNPPFLLLFVPFSSFFRMVF